MSDLVNLKNRSGVRTPLQNFHENGPNWTKKSRFANIKILKKFLFGNFIRKKHNFHFNQLGNVGGDSYGD